MRLVRWLMAGALVLMLAPGAHAQANKGGVPRFAHVWSRTRVAFQPIALVTGFGSVWVANDLGVERIAPQNGEITAEVSVGGVGSVAADPTGVWISSYAGDVVARIDPATNRILWTTHVAGPLRLAVGEGSVWAWSPMVGRVSRIDPATGDLLDTITVERHVKPQNGVGGEYDNHGFAPGLAVGAGSVWVANRDRARLVRIDPATGRVTGRIRTGGTQPIEVTVGNGAVWVSDYADKLLSRVDPATERVRSFALPGYAGQITVRGHAVWVASTMGVLRVDPRSGRVLRALKIVPTPTFSFWGLTRGPGGLWVSSLSFESGVDDVLYRVDPTKELRRPALPPIMEPAPGILPVHVTPNVALTSGHVCTEPGAGCRQFVDVYAPTGPGRHPVIVLAHEVCGEAGCKRYLATLADVLAVDGAVVFNADFGDPQGSSGSDGLAKRRELACAVRFARARAPAYGGDPSRVTLVTHQSASRSGTAVALHGDALVGSNCLVRSGSALPDAFVPIAGAPAHGASGGLRGNPYLQVRLVVGSYDQKLDRAQYRAVRAFANELSNAGYDSTLTLAANAGYMFEPARNPSPVIDVGSARPTVGVIMRVARGGP